MRLQFAVLFAFAVALGGCQRGSGDQNASQRAVQEAGGSVPTGVSNANVKGEASTGAAGTVTGRNDPNPTGSGATAGAATATSTADMKSTSPTDANPGSGGTPPQ